MIDEKVFKRIHNLLALANDSRANEAEAQLAMERAQEIMLKHNLTVATVEARGGAKETRLKEKTDKKLMFKWQRELFETVAKVNFCYFTLTYKTTASGEEIAGGYEIIGRQSNVIAARNMYDYLASTIARLVKQECGASSSAQFTRYANSFRLGCVDRLSTRLLIRHEEKVAEQSRSAREENARSKHPGAPTGTALAIILTDFVQEEADLNTDMRRGLEPGTTAQRRKDDELESMKRRQHRDEQQALLVADGVDPEVAYWMACGYSRETAERIINPPPPKAETEAQRKKRQAKEERANARYWARQDREKARIDNSGYKAGQRSGDTVGLDEQINSAETKQIA